MTAYRVAGILLIMLLVAAACGDSGGTTTTTVPPAPATTTAAPPAAAATTLPPTTAAATTTTTTLAPPASDVAYDPGLTRDDVDCSEDALEGDGPDEFITAHFVVDGVLGQVCFGRENPTLLVAWELLYLITPPEELGPLAILAGYDSPDSDTLAFVNTIGELDGADFQMSMNLPFSDEADPEFALTVAHEFSHILAGQIEQLDRFADPASCDTFDNGEGCALPGSYLDAWVEAFWSDEDLASLDVTVDDPDAAQERCNLNPGFLGAYAATNPDEDLAESFAAFVFQVEVDTPELEDKIEFFAARPELAEFRDRAEEAGLAGLPNQFDICG